jgi:hypothetical protein
MKNLSSYCLTPEQKVLLCQIINKFGGSDHPFADNYSLPYFTVNYIKEILKSPELTEAKNNFTETGKRVFNELDKKFLN